MCLVVRHNASDLAEVLVNGKTVATGSIPRPMPSIGTDARVGLLTPAFAHYDSITPMQADVRACVVLQRYVNDEEALAFAAGKLDVARDATALTMSSAPLQYVYTESLRDLVTPTWPRDKIAYDCPNSTDKELDPGKAVAGTDFVELKKLHRLSWWRKSSCNFLVRITFNQLSPSGVIWCCGGRERWSRNGSALLYIGSNGALGYGTTNSRGGYRSVVSDPGVLATGRCMCVVVRCNWSGTELLVDGKLVAKGESFHPPVPALWTDMRIGCPTPAFGGFAFPPLKAQVEECVVTLGSLSNEKIQKHAMGTFHVADLSNWVFAVNPAMFQQAQQARMARRHALARARSLVQRGRGTVSRRQPGWTFWEMVFGTGVSSLPDDLQRRLIRML